MLCSARGVCAQESSSNIVKCFAKSQSLLPKWRYETVHSDDACQTQVRAGQQKEQGAVIGLHHIRQHSMYPSS